jgi:hypothetical protein
VLRRDFVERAIWVRGADFESERFRELDLKFAIGESGIATRIKDLVRCALVEHHPLLEVAVHHGRALRLHRVLAL